MPDAAGRRRLFVLRPTLGQGGADRVTLTLLRELDRRLFAPSLVLMRSEGEYLDDLPPDVTLHVLDSAGLATAWLPLARLLREHRPDVLFSTSGGTNIVASLAHRMAAQRGRLVLSERNVLRHGRDGLKRSVLVTLKRALYGRADEITCVSAGVADDVRRTLNIPERRLRVVLNPVVTGELERSAAEPVGHDGFGGEAPVVLGVGRLVHEKGFDVLIRAFAAVRRSRPARLVILGAGPLRDELSRLAGELGVERDVRLPGFDKNPFRYMARCSVFVLSSRNEGLPGALIQAMACGAPVVSTDCPAGPSEIVTDHEDGFLVPVDDADALADRIDRLLDRPELREAFGRRARESARRFRTDAVLDRYTNALMGLP